MRRLQLNRSYLQPCTDSRGLQQLQEHPLQAHRRKMQTHRGKRFQTQELIDRFIWTSIHIRILSFIINC